MKEDDLIYFSCCSLSTDLRRLIRSYKISVHNSMSGVYLFMENVLKVLQLNSEVRSTMYSN